jgi:Fic family protein
MVNENYFHIVSEGILNEISRKKSLLEALPEYYLHRETRNDILRKEANKHSVSLELAGFHDHSTIGKLKKSKEFNRCAENLGLAMKFGFENYNGEITQEFLEQIGKIVDPDMNPSGFRKDRVRITGATWSPPSPEKLPKELSYFCFSNSCLDNVIERALHSHFNIVRIHPFNDGNGRTARLTQNIVLEDGGFPFAFIGESERREYDQLLDKAIDSYRKKESSMEPIQDMRYTTLLEALTEKNPAPKHEPYLCSQVKSFERIKMTGEQSELYNFLALKIRDSLQKAMDKIYTGRQKKNN